MPDYVARACKKCGNLYVVRFHEETMNTAPIDVDPSPDGNVAIDPNTGYWRVIRKGEDYRGDRFKHHRATCPDQAYVKKADRTR